MTQGEIQTFLDAKVGRCTNGKCLNVINVSLASQPAYVSDSTGRTACTALSAVSNVKVAALIYRVQVACGISAKVILVTLQKEQGLVTKTAPSDYALRFAMGMNCPDTSGCSAAAAGLGVPDLSRNPSAQDLQGRARTFGSRAITPSPTTPTSDCGSKTIKIQNYATAALYNYTPYQPNARRPRQPVRHRRLVLVVRQPQLLAVLHRVVRLDAGQRKRLDRHRSRRLRRPHRRHPLPLRGRLRESGSPAVSSPRA